MIGWLVACLVYWLVGWLVGWLLAWLVGWLFACSLACSLAFFGSLCLLFCIWFAWLTCETRAVEHQILKFLVFNLLALVWLKLARLVIFLRLLACFALLCLLCFSFVLLCSLGLRCFAVICDA